MPPTPDSTIKKSYHQGQGVHPKGVNIEYIKAHECAMNQGNQAYLNDGG